MGPISATALDGALLEREQELARLDDLVAGARAAVPAVAVIEGPAGIGKSRLLLAARERARLDGFRTLAARGSDLERGFAYGVVRQLFEPTLSDGPARERWLTGPAAGAARVFDPAQLDDPAGDVGFAAQYGLSGLTANIAAEGPLLIEIDDLQWSDRASLRFLIYLLLRLEGLPVLIAATIRTGEPHVETRLLDEVLHDPAATVLRPRGLSRDAVAALVQQRLGTSSEPAFTAACHEASGGNPLLLGEVLKTMHAERITPDSAHVGAVLHVGTRAVSRSVLLRLARLSPDAIAVAQAVAVLGEGADLPSTAVLSECSEERVAAATRTLAAAEILRSESPLGFVHPLVREAVYLELTPAERELRHERAARALTELGAPLERIAAHLLFVPARSDASVAAVLEQVGQAALHRADPEAAVAHFRRALEEPPAPDRRAALILDLGLAEALALDAGAVEHLSAGFEAATDPRRRALAAETMARMLLFSSPSQAAAVARRAGDELTPEFADERWRLEAVELLAVQFGARVNDAYPRLEAARGGLRGDGLGDGLGARMLAIVAASDWAMRGGSAAQCTALAREALADGLLIAADPAPMAGFAAYVLDLADDEEGTRAVLEASRAAASRSSSELALSGIEVCFGYSWLHRGELLEAQAALRPVEPRRTADPIYGLGFLAQVLVERGDVAGARAALRELPPSAPGSDADAVALQAQCMVLLAERRWEQALEMTERYGATLREGVVNPAWAPWRSLRAQALSAVGRAQDARELLEQELVWARRWGAPRALTRTLRLIGTTGPAVDLEALHEALAVSEGTGARLEHAKALVALGAALRRARKPTEARELLQRGHEIAARCGAAPLEDHARTELAAAGGRPARGALSGADALTPSERRIAALAAGGMTNREIAQDLYVTPRTVEYHLTGVYRKLGIATRSGLVGALARDPE